MATLHHHQPFSAAAAKTNLITNTATGKPPYPTPPLEFRFFSNQKQTKMQGSGGVMPMSPAGAELQGSRLWREDVERVAVSCEVWFRGFSADLS
jgi:hypothetical protein